MLNLKVTLVQANQVWEDKPANYANYEALLANVNTDLIVLPEMFNTGFSMNAKKLAESWGNREGIEWLVQLANKYNAAVYTSLIIQEKSSYYNRGVFIFPDGKITHYDKRKLFGLAKENETYTPGEKEVIVQYKGWKFQLQICYDLRFPEIVRNNIVLDKPNYDAILYVANWPEKRITHWNSLLTARAIENQSYVIGVNRVGKDQHNLRYNGASKMIDALGTQLNIKENSEEVKTVVLNSTDLYKIRESLPFLCDV